MKWRTRIVATVSACALALGSAAPAMADGGKRHHNNKDDKRGAKIVNIQNNIAVVNQTAIAVNIGSGTALAANGATVYQSNK